MSKPYRTFVQVVVTVTEAEYNRLRTEACLMPEGFVSEAFRAKAGFTLNPHGFKSSRAAGTAAILTESEYMDKLGIAKVDFSPYAETQQGG